MNKQASFRLAMREEGDWWRAYYADLHSMEGAVEIGAIRMRFVQNPERKAAFMGVMREALDDVVEEITGERSTWPKPEGERAPEHERSGKA